MRRFIYLIDLFKVPRGPVQTLPTLYRYHPPADAQLIVRRVSLDADPVRERLVVNGEL